MKIKKSVWENILTKNEQNLRTPIPWTYRYIPHFSLVVLENNSSNSALSSGTVVSIGTSAFDRNCADGSTPLTSFKTFWTAEWIFDCWFRTGASIRTACAKILTSPYPSLPGQFRCSGTRRSVGTHRHRRRHHQIADYYVRDTVVDERVPVFFLDRVEIAMVFDFAFLKIMRQKTQQY